MEVINETGFPHLLTRISLTEGKLAASVALRVSFDLEGGIPTPANKQYWTLEATPKETPYGTLWNEAVIKRGGTDILVFGNAITPEGIPALSTEIRAFIPGKLDHRLKVFGDRFWDRGLSGWKVSDPIPFSIMPLSLANAYGGKDYWDGLEIPYGINPFGKGFALYDEALMGKPLPNIEDPRNLIYNWTDKPGPYGFGPIRWCESRIKAAVMPQAKDESEQSQSSALIYNDAFYDMVVQNLSPGDWLFLEGVHSNRKFSVKIPSLTLKIDLRFGEKSYERFCYIDQLGVEPDHNRIFLTYRYAFNYQMREKEKRIIKISVT
jgi:hypothetical protein